MLDGVMLRVWKRRQGRSRERETHGLNVKDVKVKKYKWRNDNLYLIGKRRRRLYQTFELYATKQRHPYKLYTENWETADSMGQIPPPLKHFLNIINKSCMPLPFAIFHLPSIPTSKVSLSVLESIHYLFSSYLFIAKFPHLSLFSDWLMLPHVCCPLYSMQLIDQYVYLFFLFS